MARDYENFDDQPRRGGGGGMMIPVAFAALIGGAMMGGIVGYLGHALFSEPEIVIPPAAVIKEGISEDDLLLLCEELTADEKERVRNAQEKVATLQSEISAKEAELSRLKKDAKGNEERRRAASRKWREMEQDIATLRIELAEAEQERDELRVELQDTIVELKATVKELDYQVKQTEKFKKKAKQYKEESTKNLWAAFMNNGKVEICDRGSRKRHEKCHDAVELAFNTRVHEKFTVCVDTYQAVPVLKQLEKKENLPQFAERLTDDNKFTKKNWVIIYCDPTLPEARDLDLEDVEAPGRDAMMEDDGEDDFEIEGEEDLDDFDLDLE